MNLRGRRFLARNPLTGVWYRALPPQFFADGLGFAHTPETTSRFSAGSPTRPGFPLLYLAEDYQVSLFEVRAMLGSGLPGRPALPNPAAGPRTVFPVSVHLSGVVDLCDPSQLHILDTTIQELTGDWEGYAVRPPAQPAPTQLLGAALYGAARVEAFLTYSSVYPTKRNLVVFPAKLRPGSTVRVTDPANSQVILRLP